MKKEVEGNIYIFTPILVKIHTKRNNYKKKFGGLRKFA